MKPDLIHFIFHFFSFYKLVQLVCCGLAGCGLVKNKRTDVFESGNPTTNYLSLTFFILLFTPGTNPIKLVCCLLYFYNDNFTALII